MTNTLLWLAYLLSGVAAFFLVYRQGWRIVGSMIAGTVLGLLLSVIILLLFPAEEPTPWMQVELAMNGSLSLIFAGAGAALAYALREASRGPPDL